MFAAALPRLATALLQPPVLAAGLVTGIAAGAVGVGTGAIPVTDPGPRLAALFECPESEQVVKNLPPNQNVLVTARSADGSWLQIYVGEPGVERAWARAASLQLKAAPDSLPVADCTPEATPEPLTEPPTHAPSVPATEAPSIAPSAPPVTPSPTPAPSKTPKPTKVPTPPPTPPTGPTVTKPEVAYPYTTDPETGHFFIWKPSASCSDLYQATIAVNVDDPDGIETVDHVTMYYVSPGAQVSSLAMYLEDPPTGLWQGDLFAEDNWEFGVIEYWVQATDVNGDKSPLAYPTSSFTLELSACT